MEINQICDLINTSNLTLIGYNSSGEFLKDRILKELDFSVMDWHNDKLEFTRNFKILDILSEKPTHKPIVINVNSGKDGIFGHIQSQRNNQKIVITTQIYTSDAVGNELSFRGGNILLSMCDLCLVVRDGEFTIMKNKYGELVN